MRSGQIRRNTNSNIYFRLKIIQHKNYPSGAKLTLLKIEKRSVTVVHIPNAEI